MKTLLDKYSVVQNFEVLRLKKDKSPFWTSVNIRTVRDENGGVLYYEGFTQDITERKQAEAALKEREIHLSTLINSSTDPILSLDSRRVITDVNQAFLNQFGTCREETIGQSMAVFHPTGRSFEEFGQQVYPIIIAEGHWRGEREYRRRDGTLLPMETVVTAIRNPDQEVIGYMSIMRDITNRRPG